MIKIVRDFTALQSMADDWAELSAAFDTPLLGHDWFLACAKAFCSPGQLHVVAIVSGGSLRAAAPLVTVSHRGVKWQRLLTAFTGEPGGFLYRDEDSLQELVAALVAGRSPLFLARLPGESAEIRLLQASGIRRGVWMSRLCDASPWLPIDDTWENYEASRSSSRRAALRRARKRAEACGPLAVAVLCPPPDAAEEHLEKFSRVEAASWKGSEGGSLAQLPRLRHFFAHYLESAARCKTLRIASLSIAGKPAAGMLGVVHARRFWVLKIAYDPAFAACSPGTLLVHETIQHAFREGLEAYEFLGIDEPWLHAWTDHLHHYTSPSLYPYSLGGMAACGIDTCVSGFNRALRLVAS